MKTFIVDCRASATVEAAIVTSALLLVILFMLTALVNEYVRVSDYCGQLHTEAKIFADSNQGNLLRLLKVLVDTGGNIAEGFSKG